MANFRLAMMTPEGASDIASCDSFSEALRIAENKVIDYDLKGTDEFISIYDNENVIAIARNDGIEILDKNYE